MERSLNPYYIPRLVNYRLSIQDAADRLLRELKTDLDTLRLKTRKKEIVSKRQAMAYLLRWYGFTYSSIALLFMQDHCTVIHSERTVENDMLTNKELKDFIRRMQHTVITKN